MSLIRKPNRILAALATAFLLTACGDDDVSPTPPPDAGTGTDAGTDAGSNPVMVGEVVALTASNKLISFDRATPGSLVGSVNVTGLSAGESLLGIDYRPADSQLYGLTSGGRIVTLAPDTGVATVKSTLAAMAGDDNPFSALSGTDFAVDFNPLADRLRVVSDTGQNLRINVDSGATTTDGVINRSPAAVVFGAAYTNSVMGTTATALYDLERSSNVLAKQDPPNNGTLIDVGALGAMFTGAAGFDIAGGDNGLPLVAGRTAASGPYVLYQVNLLTGAATFFPRTATTAELATIGGASGPELRDIAIVY